MSSEIKICFIGDSLVNGACDSTMLGWTGRVSADAYKKGVSLTYYNLGVRGNTSSDILSRWKSECSSRLSNSNDARIVLSCGINDTVLIEGGTRISTQASCKNISTFLHDAAEYSLCIIGPPPVSDDNHNKRIESLSREFSKIADSCNVPYINIFESLIKDAVYIDDILANHNCFPEGYHPTKDGYSMIAQEIIASPKWWFYES